MRITKIGYTNSTRHGFRIRWVVYLSDGSKHHLPPYVGTTKKSSGYLEFLELVEKKQIINANEFLSILQG